MSTQEVFVQQFAKLFVHYEEALQMNAAGSASGPASWQEMPEVERDRLVAAARLALLELETSDVARRDRSRYFAKPGEAEWGC